MTHTDLSIDLQYEASPAWLALAAGITFGAPGERYRRLHLEQQIQRFAEPVFLSARRDQALLGVYVLDRRQLYLGGHAVTGFYRALFGVRDDHRGQGVGTALAARAMEWIDTQARAAGEPMLSYGCIATDNAPSLAVLDAQGGVPLGMLTSRLLYRQWPQASGCLIEWPDSARSNAAPGGSQCEAGRQDPEMARDGSLDSAGDATDAVYAAIDATPSNLPRFTLADPESAETDAAGCPRIAARVGMSTIAMADVGPVTRLGLKWLIRPWPFARRRFDPESLTYLRVSHWHLRAGCENDAPAFLAALLAHHGVNYALVVLDKGSALASTLADAGLFDNGIGRYFLPAPQALQIIGRWHVGGEVPIPPLDAVERYRLMPVDL